MSAEEAQGIRLVAPLLALAGVRQRVLGEGVRLLQAASQQLRLPQEETTERLIVYPFRGNCLFYRLREQRHGVGDAPGQGVRRAQGWSHPGEIAWKVRVLTDAHGPFEQGEGPGQVALAEEQQTNPPRGNHEARGVRNRLGNPEPFFPKSTALGEPAQLGMAPGKVGTGVHGGQDNLTEALAALRPVEGRYGLPEAVDRPTIVALELVGYAEELIRLRVQDDLPGGRGERQGTLSGGNGLVMRAYELEMACQKDRDLSQPTRVNKGCCEGLGLTQRRQHTPRVARRKERCAQGEPEIDGLLARVADVSDRCGRALSACSKDPTASR